MSFLAAIAAQSVVAAGPTAWADYASDDGAGMSNDAPLSTARTLNNALGGSGTRTWNDISSGNYNLMYTTPTPDVWAPQGASARSLVTLDSSDYRISVLFYMLSGSAIAWGCSEEANTIVSESVVGLLTSGLNSLRLREYAGGTDHDTDSFSALSTSTWYTARFTKEGDDFTAEILNEAGDTVLASATATVASTTGTHFGFGCVGDGNSVYFRNFLVEAPA